MDFSGTVQAQIAGIAPRFALLVHLDWTTGDTRLWTGFGDLVAGGQTWRGIGDLGQIQGLSQVINGAAPPLSLTLSGVDATFYGKAQGASSEYYYRPVTVFGQFFDADWQTLDAPFALRFARMTRLRGTRTSTPEGPVYTVGVEAESFFVTRRRPRFGFLTDADQRKRYAGDRGLERVLGIEQKVVKFPDF